MKKVVNYLKKNPVAAVGAGAGLLVLGMAMLPSVQDSVAKAVVWVQSKLRKEGA